MSNSTENTIAVKANQDLELILAIINNSPLKTYINNMFIKGPPINQGFMWCQDNGGPDCYWTEKEAQGLRFIRNKVLELGWESSGYGIMMRKIQRKIKELAINKSPMIYNDDEGKWDGDPRNGIGYINNIPLRRIDYIG